MKRIFVLVASLIFGSASGPSVAHRVDHVGRALSAPAAAAAAYARMTPTQRIGQLFMVGVPSDGPSHQLVKTLRQDAIGNVILNLNTSKSVGALRTQDTKLSRRLTVGKVVPYISTDQEGGLVQRLRGPGFSTMPTALAQGGDPPSRLRSMSATWGGQLRRARVNLDLAPVGDVVPAEHAKQNQPIGQFDREFGHAPGVVASHVDAFIRGMHDAGEAVTVKHFPGLGRASGNTDLTPHVTDPTTRNDPYLKPFHTAVTTGTDFLMVSSATYPKIDPRRPACFSSTIMQGMVRHDLGFGGVVVSDDLGTSALAHVPLGKRATKFFGAGGTMLLDTSPSQVTAMAAAVAAKQQANPAFAAIVKRAVLTVLATKAADGLIAS